MFDVNFAFLYILNKNRIYLLPIYETTKQHTFLWHKQSSLHEIHYTTKQTLHAENLINHAAFSCKTSYADAEEITHLLTSISATWKPFHALTLHWPCSVPGSFLALNEAFVIAHLETEPAWWGEADTEMPIGFVLGAPGGLCFNPFFIAFVNWNTNNRLVNTMPCSVF